MTHHASGIQSAFNWHPSGEWLGFALEDRIACCHAGTGDITFLTDTHAPSADAIVFSPDGKQIALDGGGGRLSSAVGYADRTITYWAGIGAGGITELVASVAFSLFSTRDLIELSVRNISHGSSRVSMTAVNGMSSATSDFTPQLVSLSPSVCALIACPDRFPSCHRYVTLRWSNRSGLLSR